MLNITVDDSFLILAAIVRQALSDVRSGTEYQRYDAESFLNTVAPSWQTWPAIHQQRGAITEARRLAQTTKKPAKFQRQRA